MLHRILASLPSPGKLGGREVTTSVCTRKQEVVGSNLARVARDIFFPQTLGKLFSAYTHVGVGKKSILFPYFNGNFIFSLEHCYITK